MTDNLPHLLKALYDIRQQKSTLDKNEKAILADLKPLVDPHFDSCADLGLPVSEFVLHAGGLDLFRTAGTSRSIQADLLLERGVSPDVVAYSTKTTTYSSYRVKEAK